MTDKRAHLDEINREWGWWTPEARNGARVWMTTQLEEAWAALEVKDIRDVSREAFKDTLDMATDVMKKAIARAEAAEKRGLAQKGTIHRGRFVKYADTQTVSTDPGMFAIPRDELAYQRRHRKWALEEARYWWVKAHEMLAAVEATEADRDKLAQRVKRLEEALNDVWARMDRARSILQDPKLGGNPKDPWMMLDTRVDRARAALEEKP